MASTYTSRLRLEKQASGENDTTWGTKLNTGIDLTDDAIAGMATINTTGGTTTLSTNNAASDEARMAILKITGTLVSNATIEIPALTKKYVVWNATSGSFSVTVKTSGGSGIVIGQGKVEFIFCDATDTMLAVHDRVESIAIAISDETTVLTTGTAKATFRMPYAFTLSEVRASLSTASSSGTPTFDINEDGATILSTKITIDANEKTSKTAAAPPVISDADLADDAEITIDIDVAGTGAKGAKIYLIGYRP